jgi:SAM-dependent methyltransferase
MEQKQNIFLPGLSRQIETLLSRLDVKGFSIALLGPNSTVIARRLAEASGSNVIIVVEDYESLINTRTSISGNSSLDVRLMSYESTDFKPSSFDLVYAQGSVSGTRRNKIIKEIKRILKPAGYLSIGEITALSDNTPTFVRDIWKNTDQAPLQAEKAEAYYMERKLKTIYSEDLSYTLKRFYSSGAGMLKDYLTGSSEEEKQYYKKLINRISHETNAYLKQGADKFIGFQTLLLQKQEDEAKPEQLL